MKINLTFLGTGQAIPSITRNHTSILLNYKDENILIDCGEGTQRQLRIAKINPCKITRILITHWHGDHILGLPGLFQTLALNNYKNTLKIYGPKGTKKFIKEIFKVFFLVKKLKIKVEEVSGVFLENKDFILSTRKLSHKNTPCNGYEFKERDKLRINKKKLLKLKLKSKNKKELARLIQGKDIKIGNKNIKSKDLTYFQKGKKISFILDTKVCENAKKLAKESDLAIIESTYLNSERLLAGKYGHMTAQQAAKIANLSKVKELILTHISQRYEYKENLFIEEAKKLFKKMRIAKDFMKITL